MLELALFKIFVYKRRLFKVSFTKKYDELLCVSSLFESESESRSVMSDSFPRHGLYSPWTSPGQDAGVGSRSLLQRIFPTEGRIQVSHIAVGSFSSWATRKAHFLFTNHKKLLIILINVLISINLINFNVNFQLHVFSSKQCDI